MIFTEVLLPALEIMPGNWEGVFIEASFVSVLKRTSGCQRDAYCKLYYVYAHVRNGARMFVISVL
jgi:hypothetical protein